LPHKLCLFPGFDIYTGTANHTSSTRIEYIVKGDLNMKGTPSPNSMFKIEYIDGETLLYHVGETRTVYLNDTASMIWTLCDGQRSVDDIVTLLEESYPEAAGQIREDVEAAVTNFVDNGAMTVN